MGRRQPLGLNVRLRYVQDVSGLDERVRALHATWCVVAVVAGRCDLEFGAPVAGVYRVRVERKTGLEVGYVVIEAV